jgi:hypothetical protein
MLGILGERPEACQGRPGVGPPMPDAGVERSVERAGREAEALPHVRDRDLPEPVLLSSI